MNEKKLIISSVIGVFIMAILLGGYWTMKKEQLTITIKGKEKNISTFEETVEEVLKEAKITYDEDDIVTPSLETKLVDYMDIKVVQVEKITEKEYESIDFDKKIVEDKNLEKGKTRLEQEGENGEKELVYELTYNDGKLVSKDLESERISKEPKEEIVKKGTKEKVVLAQNTTNQKYMKVEATAYAGDTITATGTVPKWGTIAVDPKVIPYGTKVYIPQFDKTFVAEDCGGAIKGNKIDIFMNSESQVYDWGRRSIDIYVLG